MLLGSFCRIRKYNKNQTAKQTTGNYTRLDFIFTSIFFKLRFLCVVLKNNNNKGKGGNDQHLLYLSLEKQVTEEEYSH